MPPSLTAEPPPEGPRSRAKNVVHVLFHLFHLFIAFLLFITILAGLETVLVFYPRFLYKLCILYLVPLAVYDLAFTLIQLFKIDGSRFLPRPLNFGIFARIQFRAYLYLLAAVISFSLSLIPGDELNLIQAFSAVFVGFFGLWMLVLGCIASRFGFLDWIQEVQREEQEERQRIQLPMSSDDEGNEEDLFEGTVRRRRERPRAKTFVRNAIHVWDLLTILLLFPITLVIIIPVKQYEDFFLYITFIPMMIFSVAYTLVWFRKERTDGEARGTLGKTTETFLTHRQFGFFSRIRARGFIYQAFAIILVGHSSSPEASIAWLVWGSGAGMFVFGCIASQWGFLDWLQEEEGKEDSSVWCDEGEESNIHGHENTAQATGEHPDPLHV
ncbi:hypothetical protein FRC19_005654 [Serendipita sp. 401]|nr:hypothetical protein FRC19_005654 [Serendipita sp. 401]